MSVNDQICWAKEKLDGSVGDQQCGNAWWNDQKFRVTGCEVTLSGSTELLPLTVRVWTNLDGDPNDESFGIGNVVVERGHSGWIVIVQNSVSIDHVCSGICVTSRFDDVQGYEY